MSYYTAPNRRCEGVPRGILVWERAPFSVYEWQGRYTLLLGVTEIAELVNGAAGLTRQHGDNFERWISQVRRKDAHKVRKLRALAAQVERDADAIAALWKSAPK